MFGSKVNYTLTPVYPQHKALTEYGSATNDLKARVAVSVRAIGITANALKTSIESAGSIRAVGIVRLGIKRFLLEVFLARSSEIIASDLKARTSCAISTKHQIIAVKTSVAAAVGCLLPEEILPPGPGPRYSTARAPASLGSPPPLTANR